MGELFPDKATKGAGTLAVNDFDLDEPRHISVMQELVEQGHGFIDGKVAKTQLARRSSGVDGYLLLVHDDQADCTTPCSVMANWCQRALVVYLELVLQ